MTEHAVTHATFVVERVYESSPEKVFKAWSQPEIKARWFGPPEDWAEGHFEFDFRVGGREFHESEMNGKNVSCNAFYQDIIPNERIIFTYEMHLEDRRMSVSLSTMTLKSEGKKTRLIYTEQGAYLDEFKDQAAGRKEGFGWLLDALGKELQHQLSNV